jgi:hypothetical protein
MANVRSIDVRCTWMELRGASGTDPGEIVLIHFVIDGATLSLTDALGHKLNDGGGNILSVQVPAGEEPSALAKRLTRRAVRTNRARSGTPMFYDQTVIV